MAGPAEEAVRSGERTHDSAPLRVACLLDDAVRSSCSDRGLRGLPHSVWSDSRQRPPPGRADLRRRLVPVADGTGAIDGRMAQEPWHLASWHARTGNTGR